TVDACDALPIPQTVSTAIVVDPNSTGVFSSLTGTGTDRRLAVSTDGGATWIPGAPLGTDCACYRAFAGPAAGQLYVLGTALSVSLDAGLSIAAVHPVAPSDAF